MFLGVNKMWFQISAAKLQPMFETTKFSGLKIVKPSVKKGFPDSGCRVQRETSSQTSTGL
jgi:hypothetical protein